MDSDQRFQYSSNGKTHRSSSVTQHPHQFESPTAIKPQLLLKKLEEILYQRQQSLQKPKKKKINTCRVDFTERLSQKVNAPKPEVSKWKAEFPNFVTERKTANPKIMSLQPSAQNIFDFLQQECNSRNPTVTSRAKKTDGSPKKGRVNSILESNQQGDKGTLMKLNQQLQIQNNHLNDQLRFEKNQNTKLNLLIISLNDQITQLTKQKQLLFRIIIGKQEVS